ncbi:MAG: hypothetical protein QM831_46075 [Kofleriaceae bacterium]
MWPGEHERDQREAEDCAQDTIKAAFVRHDRESLDRRKTIRAIENVQDVRDVLQVPQPLR